MGALFARWQIKGLLGLANRQRVALNVHLRLNMISGANVSYHPGGCIGMHTHLITVILLDEIGTGFNAHHLALDGVGCHSSTDLSPARTHTTGPRRLLGLIPLEASSVRRRGIDGTICALESSGLSNCDQIAEISA